MVQVRSLYFPQMLQAFYIHDFIHIVKDFHKTKSENQPPPAQNAEDFPRTKGAEDLAHTTRPTKNKLSLIYKQ